MSAYQHIPFRFGFALAAVAVLLGVSGVLFASSSVDAANVDADHIMITLNTTIIEEVVIDASAPLLILERGAFSPRLWDAVSFVGFSPPSSLVGWWKWYTCNEYIYAGPSRTFIWVQYSGMACYL